MRNRPCGHPVGPVNGTPGNEARRLHTRHMVRNAVAAASMSRMDATSEGVRQAYSDAIRQLEVLYRLLAPKAAEVFSTSSDEEVTVRAPAPLRAVWDAA